MIMVRDFVRSFHLPVFMHPSLRTSHRRLPSLTSHSPLRPHSTLNRHVHAARSAKLPLQDVHRLEPQYPHAKRVPGALRVDDGVLGGEVGEGAGEKVVETLLECRDHAFEDLFISSLFGIRFIALFAFAIAFSFHHSRSHVPMLKQSHIPSTSHELNERTRCCLSIATT